MKRFTLLALLVLLLLPACSASNGEMSDDQALAAASKATGYKLDRGDVAFHRPAGFPQIIIVAGFAHDRGHRALGTLVNGKWVTGPDSGKTILAAMGWQAADNARRKQLAQQYWDDAMCAFGSTPVREEQTAFRLDDTPPWTPLEVNLDDATGTVTLRGWLAGSSGMVWEVRYHRVEVVIAADGTLTSSTIDNFRVDGQRIADAEAAANK
ncbi:MAG: hypothetical protein AB7K09_26175 [Planctomycetota bacterium]